MKNKIQQNLDFLNSYIKKNKDLNFVKDSINLLFNSNSKSIFHILIISFCVTFCIFFCVLFLLSPNTKVNSGKVIDVIGSINISIKKFIDDEKIDYKKVYSEFLDEIKPPKNISYKVLEQTKGTLDKYKDLITQIGNKIKSVDLTKSVTNDEDILDNFELFDKTKIINELSTNIEKIQAHIKEIIESYNSSINKNKDNNSISKSVNLEDLSDKINKILKDLNKNIDEINYDILIPEDVTIPTEVIDENGEKKVDEKIISFSKEQKEKIKELKTNISNILNDSIQNIELEIKEEEKNLKDDSKDKNENLNSDNSIEIKEFDYKNIKQSLEKQLDDEIEKIKNGVDLKLKLNRTDQNNKIIISEIKESISKLNSINIKTFVFLRKEFASHLNYFNLLQTKLKQWEFKELALIDKITSLTRNIILEKLNEYESLNKSSNKEKFSIIKYIILLLLIWVIVFIALMVLYIVSFKDFTSKYESNIKEVAIVNLKEDKEEDPQNLDKSMAMVSTLDVSEIKTLDSDFKNTIKFFRI